MLRVITGILAAASCLATMWRPGWIETLTGWDPDAYTGNAEAVISTVLLAAAAAQALRAAAGTAARQGGQR